MNVYKIERSKAIANISKFLFSVISIVLLFVFFAWIIDKFNCFKNILTSMNRFREINNTIKEFLKLQSFVYTLNLSIFTAFRFSALKLYRLLRKLLYLFFNRCCLMNSQCRSIDLSVERWVWQSHKCFELLNLTNYHFQLHLQRFDYLCLKFQQYFEQFYSKLY